MSLTDQFVKRLGTYSPDMLDDSGQMPAYREQVREVITPKFAADFDKEVATAEQLVAQGGITRTADVFATAVSSIDDDSARVLVAGAFTDSYEQGEGEEAATVDQEPLPFRFTVDLVMIDGEWLVDDFTPVSSAEDEPPPARRRHGRGEHAVSDAPTWYDLLDVPRDASTEEIRAAWKTQIADLEPGDRRFDALNRAAKVLLDPARAGGVRRRAPARGATGPAGRRGRPGARHETRRPRTATTAEPGRRDRTSSFLDHRSAAAACPTWLLAGLGVVAAGLVAATAVDVDSRGRRGGDDVRRTRRPGRGRARRRTGAVLRLRAPRRPTRRPRRR